MYVPKNSKNSRHVETITEGLYTVYNHPDVTNIVECIKNKFYFATLISNRQTARSTENIQFFNIDNELVYNNFYNDFGPLNLACLYRYCSVVNRKLKNPNNKHKQIVHCTSSDQEKRANAAYLIASFAILYLQKSPNELYKFLEAENEPSLKPFQDASMGAPIYNINLLDCLNGLYKAATYGFFNFGDFDLTEYEKYLHVKNGDLNWLVPQKFLAFLGPSTELGSLYHPPERYIDYFIKNDVVAVVRLNKKAYDASRFTRTGIRHYDMFMPDGSIPPHNILHQFLQLAENTNGAIAVHCKAGLGRTGTLIAAYLMKHYRMSAREAIGWMRICRPGSVIGHQQAWLESIEAALRKAGQQYRLNRYNDVDIFTHHKRGIYSIISKMEKKINPTLAQKTFRSNYPQTSAGTLQNRELLVPSRMNPVRKEKCDAEKHKH
ncbi:dual specificity protein phosphatase CDC14A-like [Belonocnema kinseyi]|uniref:dual specificity protein phosphatase CDC14A-like n=1 Tax=Belonocnema kinseyi TaxID=2817044 RepID=UPI00143CD495|nr:dual specificity protein phosphatase CDC14A-like [Belonocnema kinseyi]XP_033212934.1 dual specificity protein phosphatase CDC14A-like [Belonocnema kinseyi]